MTDHQTVLVLDFGGQYTQLIARRVRENGVYCEIHPFDISLEEVRQRSPVGMILSGGPQSVNEEGSPQIAREVLTAGIPILGICYGMQIAAKILDGQVTATGHREYGRTSVTVNQECALFAGLDAQQTVWMSHGDLVEAVPAGSSITGSSSTVPVVAFSDEATKLHCIQFHPEVTHTPGGQTILANFLRDVCGTVGDWAMTSYLEETVASIRDTVGSEKVICGISGGVDSSVAASLVSKAVGDQLTAVFVDNGVLRKGERHQVEQSLRDGLGVHLVVVDARERFLGELAGITDPELKRKTIGRVFIEVFQEEAKRIEGAHFLVQGTLYPDVIESVSVGGPSATIKTHHNVGGLPEELGFELIEPLRTLFKDEVRQLGRELGIPEELIGRHPFPGPGLAVRILGEVTKERVATLQEADAIFIEELRAAGLYDSVSQALAVLLPIKTVGVMGDFRTYDQVLALRCVETQDFMTADWSQLPHELLGRVASRIVNEVNGVNRVVYDITSKPPGTIEWE